MPLQLEIPKDQPPRPEQEWGFTIWEFILENKWYLLAIILLLVIFYYARHSWRKKTNKILKSKIMNEETQGIFSFLSGMGMWLILAIALIGVVVYKKFKK